MIKNLVFDCDGVLTDGKYYYSKEGKFLVTFHANDSVAIKLAKEKGLRVIMISSGGDQSINDKRMEVLNIEHYFVPFQQKAEFLKSLISLDETAYIGDCLDDMPVFDLVKVAFVPSDALNVVKEAADYVLKRRGGEGCVLETFLKLEEKGWV